MEQVEQLLKRTLPFQVVSPETLGNIAGISQRETFSEGDVIYSAGQSANDVYVLASGRLHHAITPQVNAKIHEKSLNAGDVFGWAAIFEGERIRLADVSCTEPVEVLRIDGTKLLDLLRRDRNFGDAAMRSFSQLISQQYYLPPSVANRVPSTLAAPATTAEEPGEPAAQMASTWTLTMYRAGEWIRSPDPYLMMIGFMLLLGSWYLTVEVFKLPRFEDLPGLTTVVTEWFATDPMYGLSIHTSEYYQHVWVSIRRVAIAFLLATALGVPLGLFLGWSRTFREYVFPVFELLRPIPILAWVPLAIIMFTGSETPVIFLTFLASFFATALNTMLGVESIDESYTRAAYCLGANRWQVFREVIIPGAMPYVFTGLQISVGVAWFSLVAGEMVSGQYGLGYVINTSYTMVRYPTIIIGMVTLGIVGYATSAMVRIAGNYMMQWRLREMALGGR
ncbi:MAG: ABC transporter permease subunit [Gammaproteobacteria bacterium]|jgi:NitT/TauT family transport system permease protein|nr:ABC transporter permease subunit [Gammaproteobacteria bacterium]MBU0772813.1 ABC transporter permease subunit [Gammaproteobacteria bacterium]MBU0856547.1 ABC transporter permease subunit [Gammaproteobacteria bacterium]